MYWVCEAIDVLNLLFKNLFELTVAPSPSECAEFFEAVRSYSFFALGLFYLLYDCLARGGLAILLFGGGNRVAAVVFAIWNV